MDPNNLEPQDTPNNTPGVPPQNLPSQPSPQFQQQPQQPIPPMAPEPAPGGRRKLVFVLLAVFITLGIAAAAYFVFAEDDSSNQSAKKSSESADESAVDLATLNGARLRLDAADAKDLTALDAGTETLQSFESKDGTCQVIVGTATAKELPGKDLDAIVEPQLEALRDAGASVSGPKAGQAVILRDAADSSIRYSIPTIEFEFSKDNKYAVVYYSAVILKNSERAIINRTCANEKGKVDTAKLTALGDIVSKTLVTKQ